MAEEIIKARVWQKIDTEANWMANPLVLGPGEAAFVVTSEGAPVNFKLGDGGKTFAQLPWYFDDIAKASFFGSASPSDSPDPAEGDGFWIVSEPGTYTNFGGVVLPPNSFGFITRIGTSYALIESGLDLSEYQKKQDVTQVVWGVGDEYDNVALWLDANLELHAKIAKESEPAPNFGKLETDSVEFGVGDENGNIILAVLKNGEIYPKSSSPSPSPTPEPLRPKTTVTAEDITQPSDIVKDSMWNQWIEPCAAVDSDGILWVASVGSRGDLYVTKRQPNGVTKRVKIGTIEQDNTSDDHNCPAILIDDRVGAEYPIMVFQADHNTTPMRYWKFDSKDIESWGIVSPETIGSGLVAYTQVFRYGDEIFVFSRVASGGRPWRVAYSSDNGDTWTVRNLFTRSNSWLYMLCRLKDDGSGLNIAFHDHPLNGNDQDIYMMLLDFGTGAVTAPGQPTVIPDIRAAIANAGFTAIDPFTTGTLVYNATGTQVTRLWDISRNASGGISVAFNVLPNATATLTNFSAGTYNVVRINRTGGGIISNDVVGEAGTPIENPKGSNFYFAGMSMFSSNQVVVSRWESNSQRDNTGNIQDDYGMSTVELVDIASLDRKQLCYSDKKVIRPFTVGEFVMLIECNYFEDYFDFYSNLCINEIN